MFGIQKSSQVFIERMFVCLTDQVLCHEVVIQTLIRHVPFLQGGIQRQCLDFWLGYRLCPGGRMGDVVMNLVLDTPSLRSLQDIQNRIIPHAVEFRSLEFVELVGQERKIWELPDNLEKFIFSRLAR